MEKPTSLEDFWSLFGDEKPYGCAPNQVAYVKARLEGVKGYVAAKMAGYGGDNKSLSVTASRLEKNPKVQALYEAALSVKEFEGGGVMPKDEVLKKASRIAQGTEGNATSQMHALRFLAEYHSLLEQFPDRGPDISEMNTGDLAGLLQVLRHELERRRIRRMNTPEPQGGNGEIEPFSVIDGDRPGAA